MNKTKIVWLNRKGEHREVSLLRCTLSFARDWWRRSILECQGILSVDERRMSQLRLLEIQNPLDNRPA
jgi:hypothetical protein